MITDHKLDVLCLTETWLKPDEYIILNESAPQDYCYKNEPRPKGKGGGVATIYSNTLNISQKTGFNYNSFEVMVLHITLSREKSTNDKSPVMFVLATVYRPPGHHTDFIKEFGDFISELVLAADKVLIIGDLNIHVDNEKDALGSAFLDILNSIWVRQHVSGPTHCRNHTLDLTHAELNYQSSFCSFEPISLPQLEHILRHTRLGAHPFDPLPPRLLLNLFDLLGNIFQSLLNSSLINGNVPVCFKHAVVQPLLKKPNLDCTVLSNYQPISKLPFLSKILEKVVLSQLASYLDMNAVIDMFQSGFRYLHSTESALLKVFNDIVLAVDSGKVVILIYLISQLLLILLIIVFYCSVWKMLVLRVLP